MKNPKLTGWSVLYLYYLTLVVVLGMWVVMAMSMSSMRKDAIHHNQEAINTAEDMIEWIIEDEASGNVGKDQADTYIDNLEGIIIDLGVTR